MARIKKYGETLTQPLSSFATFLVDTNPNSDYFRITEFKDTLTGGKNGFLIEGSEHLKESTEVKIQVLDVNGDPIYWEVGNGIPEYYEGISKVISLHIYEDTPIGEAKITVLGELKTYLDEGKVVREVPDEWKGVYNLKWEKTFKVNRLLSNSDKVRFYRRPLVNISEITKPIYSTTISNVTQMGKVSGIPITPVAGTNLSSYTLPTFYKLEIEDTTNWSGSIEGATINIPQLDYSPTVIDVINNKELLVREPYVNPAIGSAAGVESFTNQDYTASFNYLEGIANLKTALTGSFAKINITDLTTFVGDAVRVKIFRKSQSTVSDYQFVEEIQLESNELLVDLESQNSNLELYGNFIGCHHLIIW
jgi:flagellar hook assembly protein FlgD